MAIPRMFNSNAPFTIVTGGSELTFLGKEDSNQEGQVDTEPLVRAIGPHLSHVMQHGTAKQVAMKELQENPCVSIVAQAQREDFQEFSPSSTRYPFSRSQLLKQYRYLNQANLITADTEDEDLDESTRHHLQRKQRRKTRSQQRKPAEGEEPPVIRGLWVQEIDWLKTTSSTELIPPPPQFTDSPSCCHDDRSNSIMNKTSSSTDGSSDSDCGSSESDSDSSCWDAETNEQFGFTISSTSKLMQESGGDSTGSLQDMLEVLTSFYDRPDTRDSELQLNGRVAQKPKHLVSSFFRESMKRHLDDMKSTKPANEGLLFHPLLRPVGSYYREGEEYCVLHPIQNGSYGDVFCIQDKNTKFRCAAKRIPLSHFSSKELSTWSALKSPRVVELFGAVQDGANIVLFMDLKPACLAQLVREMTCLPEDLALHYLHQTLGALEHLHHRKVLHLDVKVDNVLLSADCRDAFLCDFGLSEMLDDSGQSTEIFRGAAFPGTESHMAPEVARGDQLCPKADVWSSCCMMLHMLNGCQPWIRYYSHPLCLQIVNEPPPLWEVPSRCNNFTAKVFRAGLQKDPERRATASELRRKTTKALRAVGGLSSASVENACKKLFHNRNQHQDDSKAFNGPIKPCSTVSAPQRLWVSPWRTMAVDEDNNDRTDGDLKVEADSLWESNPKSLRDNHEAEWESDSESDVDIYMGEDEQAQDKWLKRENDYEGDWEEDEDEWDSSGSTEFLHTLRNLFPLLQKGEKTMDGLWGSDTELEELRDDVPVGTTIQTLSPEPRDDPPSCFSCSDTSPVDVFEKDSEHSSDDLSSGVFSSCNSHTESCMDWLASAHRPSSCSFQGVDVWIENVQGDCLRIRERRRVKVGHVAIGISNQVAGKGFTLETLDRKPVSFEQEIIESGLWLRCVPAPDGCQFWRWRVQEGKLELRD